MVAETPHRRAMLCAASLLALAVGLLVLLGGLLAPLERWSLDERFALRGPARHIPDVAVVGIDDRTFSRLGLQWPFPRSLHAEVIDRLHADGVRAIAYDVQFTEPSRSPRDDLELYDAVARARDVVLATTEVDRRGQTDVFGSEANVRAAHGLVGMANLPADSDGVIRSYPRTMLGHPSFAAAAARMAGRPVSRGAFHDGRALIDYRGGPGTIPTYSFVDVLRGRVSPAALRGRVVVVGATSATLQDEHATSTTAAAPMSGAEVQADAIWTALHANPLRSAPEWLDLLALVLSAIAAPLCALRLRTGPATLLGALVTGGWLLGAQALFDAGSVLTVSAPLAAGLVGVLATFAAGYTAAFRGRALFRRRLEASQLELLQRLAQAIDSRHAETGEHTRRIGLLCRRIARELGWSERDAVQLMHAAVAHDIGKLGIADGVLLKSGPLDVGERATMQSHTLIGARLLADSQSPLVQSAERIARSHHEHWDGSGYPHGLAGEQIPIEGRICAVADVYDALVSHRTYKAAWSEEAALAELARGRGTQFDPAVLDAFLRLDPAERPAGGVAVDRGLPQHRGRGTFGAPRAAIEVLRRLRPIGVAMASPDAEDPFGD